MAKRRMSPDQPDLDQSSEHRDSLADTAKDMSVTP